jgi:hypothetical protein
MRRYTLTMETRADGHWYAPAEGGWGPFPSVTTILKATAPAGKVAALANWRKRELAAGRDPEAQGNAAKERGNAMHKWLEAYYLGHPPPVPEGVMPYLESVEPLLPPTGGGAVPEAPVWHMVHQYAGTADLVTGACVWDWKTFQWDETKTDRANEARLQLRLDEYKMQVAAYVAACNRVYGLRLGKGAILVAIPGREGHKVALEGQELMIWWRMFEQRVQAYRSIP